MSSVFVIDKKKNPLMPCSKKRARQLLNKGEAVVHKQYPFTIRLKNQQVENCELQPLTFKIDPGAKTTGIAITRKSHSENGIVENAVFLAEIQHHSAKISEDVSSRASLRRGRRSRKLRYRSPRFLNRTRIAGWLPPSVKSRVDNILHLNRKLQSISNLQNVDIEYACFDMQKMINPEISGVEYQQGTLYGYEVREYLLEKFNRKCVYCDATNVPLNMDHWIPKKPRKGEEKGSNRVTNFVLACIPCNQKKKNIPGPIYVKDAARLKKIQQHMTKSLAPATHTNLLRKFIYKHLGNHYGFENVHGHYAARTKYNRNELGLMKTHAIDALCCGDVSSVTGVKNASILHIKSFGRGNRQMTQTDKYGFPKSYRSVNKKMDGYQTGDICLIDISKDRKNIKKGQYIQRITKTNKSFYFNTTRGGVKFTPKNIIKIIHRNDGYGYQLMNIRNVDK